MANPLQSLVLSLAVAWVLGATNGAFAQTEHRSTGDERHVASPIEQAGNARQDTIRPLFNGKSMEGWELIEFGGQDQVAVSDGAIVAEAGYPMVGISCTAEDLPTENYRLRLDAKKIDGTDFFCLLTFPVGDSHASLVIGGWGGNVTGISCVDEQDANNNETRTLHKFETGKWYAIEVVVTAERVECFLDGEQVVNLERAGRKIALRNDVTITKPLSLCAFETRAAWRAIELHLMDESK